jgi:murein DD-endopeptidase MepM/ murein hydrolase activator NlpD
MAKIKYRYNPETLSYDRVIVSSREKLIKWGVLFLTSFVIFIAYFFLYSYIYETPKERALTYELENLKLNYQILSQSLDNVNEILSNVQQRDDNIYRTVLESDPIPLSIRLAGFGGVNRYEPLEGYENSKLMVDVTEHADRIRNQLYIQSISYDELIERAKNQELMLLTRPAIQPISNKDLTRTASGFGYRMHPILKTVRFHNGMDFTAPTGTDIYATGDGKVTDVGVSGGFGNRVIIDHGFGYQTIYAHMHTFKVKPGEEVKRGQVIGTVGDTGLSTAPHLHYEVHKNGAVVNPINYYYQDLTPEEYAKITRLASDGNMFD